MENTITLPTLDENYCDAHVAFAAQELSLSIEVLPDARPGRIRVLLCTFYPASCRAPCVESLGTDPSEPLGVLASGGWGGEIH